MCSFVRFHLRLTTRIKANLPRPFKVEPLRFCEQAKALMTKIERELSTEAPTLLKDMGDSVGLLCDKLSGNETECNG